MRLKRILYLRGYAAQEFDKLLICQSTVSDVNAFKRKNAVEEEL